MISIFETLNKMVYNRLDRVVKANVFTQSKVT